jgi:hypothetical protein
MSKVVLLRPARSRVGRIFLLTLRKPATGFKTSFGCNWLQSLWICVLGKKGSQRASARFRALFTSGLDHELFARSRYKTGFETSCRQLLDVLSV